jgi:hypothetical protein
VGHDSGVTRTCFAALTFRAVHKHPHLPYNYVLGNSPYARHSIAAVHAVHAVVKRLFATKRLHLFVVARKAVRPTDRLRKGTVEAWPTIPAWPTGEQDTRDSSNI